MNLKPSACAQRITRGMCACALLSRSHGLSRTCPSAASLGLLHLALGYRPWPAGVQKQVLPMHVGPGLGMDWSSTSTAKVLGCLRLPVVPWYIHQGMSLGAASIACLHYAECLGLGMKKPCFMPLDESTCHSDNHELKVLRAVLHVDMRYCKGLCACKS